MLTVNEAAPNFALHDLNDNLVRLTQFRGQKNILLIFNRGFL
ncbi:MAG: hypothetical protein AAF485_23230 [Chloroflexota bacterium]